MRKIINMVLPYLKKRQMEVFFFAWICLLMAVLSFATPYITGSFIDSLIKESNKNFIIQYCISYSVLFFAKCLLNYCKAISYLDLQMTGAYSLSKDIITHLYRVNKRELDQINASYLTQRINNDSNELFVLTLSLLQGIIMNSLTLIVPFAVFSVWSMKLSFFLFITVLFYSIIYFISKNKLYSNQSKLKEAQALFFSKLNEVLRYINYIKSHSVLGFFMERYERSFFELLKTAKKETKFSFAYSSINSSLVVITQVALFLVGGFYIVDGKLSVGQFTIITSYFTMMTSAISYFSEIGKRIQTGLVSYKRMVDIECLAENVGGSVCPQGVERITINDLNVSFKQTVFKHFSYTLEKGKLYGIYGDNGSGKTTLVNVLLGMFEKETQEAVMIDEVPLNDINLEYYRSKIVSYAEQENILFEGTVIDNIQLGKKDSNTTKELLGMIIEYGLFSENSLDNLMTGVINEKNTNLSGGERQKVVLMRTLINDNPILIFDEPTAALDEKAKEVFYGVLESIKKDKIIIVVTHDEAFKDICDSIIEIA